MAGCGFAAPPPPPPLAVVVSVASDDGSPLQGVGVRLGPNNEVRTDGVGRANLSLDAEEGTSFDLLVDCPQGFTPASRMPKIKVRRADRPPQFDVVCRATSRSIVVALHAIGIGEVPILRFGKPIGSTNAAGIAVLPLDPRTGDTITLTLDTSAERFRWFRPQNPELTFPVPEKDDVVTLEQRFTEEKPKVVYRTPSKPKIAVRMH